MQALPYIIMAVGTAATIKANNDAQDERRSILNSQLERDEEASKKSNAMVLQEAQKLSGQNREDAMSANEAKISAQQQQDLQAGAGGGDIGAISTSGDAGNVSNDFLKAKADRAITEGNRLTSIASELAKTRAPGMTAVEEGYGLGDLAGNLSNIGSTNANYARASGNDASMVMPGKLGQFGQIATAIGGAVGSAGSSASTAYKPTWSTSGGAGIQW